MFSGDCGVGRGRCMPAQTTWHHYGPACRDPDLHCWSHCLLPGSWFPSEAEPAAPSHPLSLKGSFPAGRRDVMPEQMLPHSGASPAGGPQAQWAGSFEPCFLVPPGICMSRPGSLASLKQSHLSVDKQRVRERAERNHTWAEKGRGRALTRVFCQGQSLSRQSHTSALAR